MGAEPAWLHTAGQIAGTLLLIELWLVLLIVCGLMIGLWLALRWVRLHLVPVVDRYGEQARGALSVAIRGGDRIVEGVAELHGREEAIRTAITTFLLGPGHGYHDGHRRAELPSPPMRSASGETIQRLPPPENPRGEAAQ